MNEEKWKLEKLVKMEVDKEMDKTRNEYLELKKYQSDLEGKMVDMSNKLETLTVDNLRVKMEAKANKTLTNTKEIKMLLDDKEILRAEIEALKNKQLDNNSRLDCLSKENKALKDVIKTLTNESKDNINEVKTLREEKDRLQVENKALRNKNMDKTKRQNILETEKEALQSEIETLKTENVQNFNKLETLTIAIAFAITITIAIAKDEFCTGNEVFKKGLENIIEEKILAQKRVV